jgi:Bacterial PH domain
MAKSTENQAVKRIKDVARVALGRPKALPEATNEPQAELTGVTPNYREDATGKTEDRAGVPKEFLYLFEHDPSEIILEQALRHPFGIYAIYAVVVLVVMLVMTFTGAILVNSNAILGMGISESAATLIGLAGILVMSLSVIGGMLSAYVYGKSRVILTNQKVVLIQYHSLFAREVSQLNIAEVEDVNVSQPTIINRLFKAGTITIETAGEQNNYTLTWIRKPYEFANHTIQAHEGSIAEYGA